MAHKAIDWAANKSGSVKETQGKPGQADWTKIRLYGYHGKGRVAGWNRYAAKTFDSERTNGNLTIKYRALTLALTGGGEIHAASGFDAYCLTCIAADNLGTMFSEVIRGKFGLAKQARNRGNRAAKEAIRYFNEARSYNDFSHLEISSAESRRIVFERYEQARTAQKEGRKAKKKALRKEKAEKRAQAQDPSIARAREARAKVEREIKALKAS